MLRLFTSNSGLQLMEIGESFTAYSLNSSRKRSIDDCEIEVSEKDIEHKGNGVYLVYNKEPIHIVRKK